MIRDALALSAAALLWVAALALPAAAQSCGPDDFAAVVDETGAALRAINADTQPVLRDKLARLAAARGWPEADVSRRAYRELRDAEAERLDSEANTLLVQFDELGETAPADATCARLDELKSVASRLRKVTADKAAHIEAKLDAAIAGKPAAVASSQQPRAPAAPSRPTREPPPPLAAQPAPQSPPPVASPRAPETLPWTTETTATPPPPSALAELPPIATPADETFTTDEIRAAGRGLFGTISAEIAGLIDYAVSAYGSPKGYILGTEGGGALIAGLRYGKGTLVTKTLGSREVHWQGPSVGYDFGLSGSRVMFLVYNLREPDDIFRRYTGIDGAAFVIGGAGITFLKKGPVVLAPIRTGLGLRLGASIGYLRFTPTARLNPF